MSNKILQMMLLSTALTASVAATSGGKDEDISNWLDRTSLSSGSSIPTICDIGEDYETGSIASMGMTEVQSVAGGSGPSRASDEKLQDLTAVRKFTRRGMLEITPKSYHPIEQATMLYATAAGKYDKGIWIKDWGAIKDLDPLEDLLLRFTQIRKFKAEYSGPDLDGFAEMLEKSVQFYKALEELDLTGCSLGKGIEEIVLSLGKPDNLKILRVKGNKLGSDDVISLHKHLSSLTVLEVEDEVSRATTMSNEGTMLELYQRARSDDEAAVNELLSSAKSGDELAQSYLAICYQSGYSVVEDADQAQHWAKRSIDWVQVRAAKGLASAQINLGTMYERGLAVDQDYGKAVDLYRKAADQGNAVAQCNLGVCYEHSNGVKKDPTEAAKWFRKAADQEYTDAQYNLGVCYQNGNGVKQDPTEAVKWFRKAADLGNAYAQYNLGVCYEHSNGVKQDPTEAVKWYRRAANQGYAIAQNNLGRCYEYGQGVDKNIDMAIQLYTKAAKQGQVNAQKSLKRLGKSW